MVTRLEKVRYYCARSSEPLERTMLLHSFLGR